MIQSNKSISPLRQRMIEDMSLRKLSPKTQTAYIRAVVKLTRFLGRSPDTATAEDLRLFQLQLTENGTSSTTVNATITGLRFLFEVTLDQLEMMKKMSEDERQAMRKRVMARHEKMMKMSEEERKAMRKKMDERHEKIMNMTDEERKAWREERRAKGGKY